MDQQPDQLAYFVQSDAECCDPAGAGQLLGSYVCDALSPSEKDVFEQHMKECIACWTDVTNWNNLGLAKGDESPRFPRSR